MRDYPQKRSRQSASNYQSENRQMDKIINQNREIIRLTGELEYERTAHEQTKRELTRQLKKSNN